MRIPFLVAAAVALGPLVASGPAVRTAQIAYVEDGRTGFHIYAVDTAGGGRHQLLADRRGFVLDLAWSPDGRQIAFVRYFRSGADSPGDIYVMNADGSRLRNLTRSAAKEVRPAWSPDGKWIAYTRSGSGDRFLGTLHVIRSDGGGDRRLPSNRHGRWDDADAAWSPDGTQIAFTSQRQCCIGGEIRVMSVRGRPERALRPDASEYADQGPHWSPDGRRIAIESSRLLKNGRYYNSHIEMIDANGSHSRSVSSNGPAANFDDPVWSPDGRKIAYQTVATGAINVVSADTNAHPTIVAIADPDGASWSPNGRELAYSNNGRIYVVAADGTGRHRVARGTAVSLVWRP